MTTVVKSSAARLEVYSYVKGNPMQSLECKIVYFGFQLTSTK